MRSSSRFLGLRAKGAGTFLFCMAASNSAWAQVAAQGFAVERFEPSAPGSAWLLLDDLKLQGKLGGAVALSGGYAHNPFHVETSDRGQRLDVISGQSTLSLGMALLYDRYRFSLNLSNPLWVKGNSGTLDGYRFTSPSVDLGKYPDKVVDVRFGIDMRLLGEVGGPFRLGLGAQLFVPSGERAAYATDGSYRARVSALFAGAASVFDYAGYVGVHLRQLDAAPIHGAPRGSELIFGVGTGPRFPVATNHSANIVLGPELFGQTAFRSFLERTSTGVEVLMSARLERDNGHGTVTRFKVGFGEGLHPEFGAPAWRCLLAAELLGRVE